MIKDHVQSIILESMAEVLKVQERLIQEDRSFSEYGVDSIVAIKLINVINQKSNLILQTTALFDYNNAEQLLHYILREHTATLRATLQERTGNKPHQQAVSQRIGTVETDPRKRTAVYFPRPSDPLPHEKPLSALAPYERVRVAETSRGLVWV